MPLNSTPLRVAALSGGTPFSALACIAYGRQTLWRRDFVEALAIVEGSGFLNRVLPNGRTELIPIGPGDLFLFRPRDLYQLIGDDRTGVGAYSVIVALPLWTAYASLAGIDTSWLDAGDPPRRSFDVERSHVIDIFDRVVQRVRRDPSMLHIIEFWVAMTPVLFTSPRVSRDRAPRWLADALEAMLEERNLAGGVPRLVELARVTPSYLSRAMRRYVGMTPSEVVLDLRLQHAARLLMSTADSIGAIAIRCGFTTSSYFGLAFRRAMGMTPRQYRGRQAAPLDPDSGRTGASRWRPAPGASGDPLVAPTPVLAATELTATGLTATGLTATPTRAIRTVFHWD